MTLLLWFILGIGVIIGISRYNEDESLFWKLLISFVGTFAAATAVHEYVNSKKQDKVEYLTSTPTQVFDSGSHIYCVLAEPSVITTPEETSSEPVSKDMVKQDFLSVLSKVDGGIRDRPIKFFDTS